MTTYKRGWATKPHEKIEVPLSASGAGSIPATTVLQAFDATTEKFADKPALYFKPEGVKQWHHVTFAQYKAIVIKTAKSFIHLGLPKWGFVGILGFNAPEWFYSDIGALYAGGIPFGIYTTNGPEACEFVLDFTKAPILVCENLVQVRKIREVAKNLPNLKAVIQYSGKAIKDEADPFQLFGWAEFLELGKDIPDSTITERTKDIEPGNCAGIIWTSGTTGAPKGVMVSHDNLTWVTRTVRDLLHATHKDSWVSYLPLSHIAAQMVDIFGNVIAGCSVYFAQPDALKGSLGETLREVRPTLFLGVPRVWEKMMEKMQAIAASNSNFKKKIATWAKKKGAAGSLARLEGKSKPSGWSLANKLVFQKVKAGLGLDRCRIAIAGAAPMSRTCTLYFMSLDIPVYEVYAMSESTGCVSMSVEDQFKIGACGKPLEGIDLKIHRPDSDNNGEVIFRGRNLMMGYLFNEEATSKEIDSEGFYHTGDIGKLFDGTHLGITGRIKELIITAGGENVPPVPIEEAIKKELASVVSNCIVIGDKRKYLVCLLTLCVAFDGDEPTTNLTNETIAKLQAIGSEAKTVSDAQKDAALTSYIENGFMNVNKHAVSNAHTIKKWAILPRELTIAGNELGPTLKMKRRTIITKYESLIESLYVE